MHFDIKKVIETTPKATTYISVGKRGVGKSYSTEIYMIEDAVYNGRQMVLVGRYKEDTQPNIITKTFDHITEYNKNTGTIPLTDIMKFAKVPQFKIWTIEARAGSLWICGRNEEGEPPTKVKQLGVYTAIKQAERFKRGSFPNVYNIFLDEFITKGAYVYGRNEPHEFMKIVNTIARAGKDYRVFLCGNPDNEIDHCPYLEHYNIDYDAIEPDSLYMFDGGNTCFIKLAGGDTEYIVKSTRTMFGLRDNSSHTGEVDRPATVKPPEDFAERFRPFVELRVETSAIAVDDFMPIRRSFYLYMGVYRGQLYCATYKHRQNPCKLQIECKYERTEVPPPRPGRIYTYRFNMPGKLKEINRILAECMNTGRIYHETDRLGNVLNNIIIMQ